MAFTLPTFNTTMNIWHAPFAIPPVTIPDETAACNFSCGRRVFTGLPFAAVEAFAGNNDGQTVINRIILAPFGLDLRGIWQVNGPDLVEIPPGSGQFYSVEDVAVMASGFPNHHLVAWAIPTGVVPFLPSPMTD
jgi:hypothetical protein